MEQKSIKVSKTELNQEAAATGRRIVYLRRRLQPEAVARRRDGVIASAAAGYVLRLAPDTVDAWCFERAVDSAAGLAPADAVRTLDDALRLWRGPPYAEYVGEPWVEAEAVRLTELHAVARERLLEARLQLGDAALLVGELEALVAEDPLREERWRLLALALYRAQRQADALAALRRARETLADELGVDPGPALRALEAEVLAQSPALDAPAPRGPGGPAGRGASATQPVATDRPRRPGPGDGGAAADGGRRWPAGVPAACSSRARRASARPGCSSRPSASPRPAEVRVLSARGSQLERSFGFGAVRQLFEPCIERPCRPRRAARRCGRGREPGVRGGGRRRRRAARQLRRPARPLLADRQPRRRRAAGDLRRRRPVVRQRVAALPRLPRQAARGAAASSSSSRCARASSIPTTRCSPSSPLDPSVTVLRPAPLSPEAAATLVRERLGEGADTFVDACHRMTSGNPLLLRQLLRALEDEGVRPDVSHVDTVRAVGSRAVSALVTLRLRRMPPTVTAAARAVAVLGEAAGPADGRGAGPAARGRGGRRPRHPEPQRDPHGRATT